jgi:hypothetical protein
MKKNIDTRSMLFEMMEKINPDYKKPQLINEEKTSDKKILNENVITDKEINIDSNDPEGVNFNPEDEKNLYKEKSEKIKSTIDSLYADDEFDAIDTLYKLMVKRSKGINEDHSPKYREKVESLKGKLDFLFDTDHYELIDKLDEILNELFPINDEEI